MTQTSAIECDFPYLHVSRIAEQESWRKEINRPLYHIHKWWATRLGSVFRATILGALTKPGTDLWAEFYRRHNLENKVVLDPFMGSGTTLGEALKLGAKAVGCDVNPISSFLVRQALTQVPEEQLRSAFARLEGRVAAEIQRYYRAIDPHTGELIPVLYYFWVKTLKTPGGEAIPLLSRWVFAQDAYPKKKPKAQILCSTCWRIFEGRYDATNVVCPHCSNSFDPQRGPASGQYVTSKSGERYRVKDLLSSSAPPDHRLYAVLAMRMDGTKTYLASSDHDRALYEEASHRLASEALPLPTMKVRSGHNTDQARGYNYTEWRQFFNDRQLLCLGWLLRSILDIESEVIREQMLCLFSSTLEFNNLFCSFKGEGTGAVRHMFSNHILKPERAPLENSVWGTEKSSGTFSTLFESRLLSAKRYLNSPFEIAVEPDLLGSHAVSRVVASDPICVERVQDWNALQQAKRGVLILNGDSSRLPVPDASIDAVITDPPYFDFVHYSELSDFFFAWLAPVLRGKYPEFAQDDSSNIGEVQQKDPQEFARRLGSVLAECRRVLRDDGVLAFSFHHSRADGWAAIYEALRIADLAVVAAYPVHAELRAASPKSAAKAPISLDAILVCKKRIHAVARRFEDWPLIDRSLQLCDQLSGSGLNLSDGDRFVIGASQVLIAAASQEFSFNEVAEILRGVDAKLRAVNTNADSGVGEDVVLEEVD